MLANNPLVRGQCKGTLLSCAALASFLGTSTGVGLLLVSFSLLGIQHMVRQQRSVEDNICGSGGERVWKKRKMPLSMGPLAYTLTFAFIPVFLNCFETLQIHWRVQSKRHYLCWYTIWSPVKPVFGQKKGLVLLNPVILNFGRKIGVELCSLPAPSAFELSGHEFNKGVPILTLSYSTETKGAW